MDNNLVIFIFSLFFSFILQFHTPMSFGEAVAQETPILNGIWDRNDDYGYNDTVFINQIGNEFTATTDGYCWPDLYNRAEGTQFANFREVFRGTLSGNTAKGQHASCYFEERTMKMVEMNLTVSGDGRTLDIYAGPPGNGFYQQYRFISDLPSSILIDVRTSKPGYNFNEQVQVVGQIKNLEEGINTLILEVYGPDGKRAFYRDVFVNQDGTFSDNFNLNNNSNVGTYLAHVAYATASKEVSFDYGVPIMGLYGPVVASGIGVVGVGAGTIFLYKHGYFKRKEQLFNGDSQNKDISDLPVIYLGIECGLENPELPKKEIRNGIETQDVIKLEQRFSKAVDDILKNRKVIKNVQKDIHFIKWCKEAKENPNKILSKLSDDIINKFLSSVSPYFGDLILSELRVESDVSVTRDRHKSIKKTVQFNLVPIEPFIEFVLYINTQRVSSAKFIFTIETKVEVKNLTVNTKATDTQVEEVSHASPEQNYGKKISIENLIFMIAVEFSSLKIGIVEKNISPPIIIGRRKVEVKKFGFSER